MLAPYRWSLLPDATCLGQSGPGDNQWVSSMWLTAMGGRCHCKAVHNNNKKKTTFYSVLLKKKNRTQARYGLHDLGQVPGTGILLDVISLLNLSRVTDLSTALSAVAIPASQHKAPTVSSTETKVVVYKRFTAGLSPHPQHYTLPH